MNGFAHIFKAFDPNQPRDEKGRWTAISFGKGAFGVENTVRTTVNGKEVVLSRGGSPERFDSMEDAQAHADRLNNTEGRAARIFVTARAGQALSAEDTAWLNTDEGTSALGKLLWNIQRHRKADIASADLDTAGKKSPEQGYGKKKYRRVRM